MKKDTGHGNETVIAKLIDNPKYGSKVRLALYKPKRHIFVALNNSKPQQSSEKSKIIKNIDRLDICFLMRSQTGGDRHFLLTMIHATLLYANQTGVS